MTYAAQYTDSQAATFQAKVNVALASVCVDIIGEVRPANLDGWNKRHDLAFSCINDPTLHLNAFAIAIVSDDITNDSSTDAAIKTRCGAVFNDLAGVRDGEVA